MDVQDFGDIAIDVMSVIREGNITNLREWLLEYQKNDEETKEQKRNEILGASSWGSNMSGLLWAIDIEDKQTSSEIAKLLLGTFPELVNALDSEKSSPLHYAALNGDAAMIQFLFNNNATISVDNNNESPLHSAAMNGHLDATKTLLKRSIDPNIQNSEGATALHLAVLNGQEDIIGLLTTHPKINLELKNNEGKRALDLALQKNANTRLLKLFEQEKNDNMDEIFQLEDDISRLQADHIERLAHINALINQKNNETHITYRRLAEIESLCEGAIRKEEELKSQTNTFVPNKMQRMIDDLKSEIERETYLTSILEQKISSDSNSGQSQQIESNMLKLNGELISQTIKTGFDDAVRPLDFICLKIKPNDHDKSVFSINKESNSMEIIENNNNNGMPPIAGFLI